MRRTLERLAEPPRQLGVVGLPDALARPDQARVEVALAEPEQGRSGREPLGLGVGLRRSARTACRAGHFVDATPLLGKARRFITVEDESVARLHRRSQVEADRRSGDAGHAAEEDPPLLPVVAPHQDFMIVSVEEAVAEPTRKRQFHLAHVAGREGDRPALPGSVQGLAVVLGDVGHVFGRLQAALDLQARDTQLNQSGNQVVRRKILRAQEILDVVEILKRAVADDLVGHPARLGALAPVGRSTPECLAGQALTGVGHAERSVHEDLDREPGSTADPGDLGQRELAGEDDARTAQLARQPDPLGARDRHLGRGVDLQVGRQGADQPGQAEVLDDHRIDPRFDQVAERFLQVGQLAGEDQGVEGDVSPDPPAVQQAHDLGEVGAVEVGGAGAGVVPLEAKVNGVRAVLDGCDQACPIPGRSQEFRLAPRSCPTPSRIACSAVATRPPFLARSPPSRRFDWMHPVPLSRRTSREQQGEGAIAFV